jgi:hypothetical protein
MTNPLLKAAGITPYTKNRSAEWALFEEAWKCVERLRGTYFCAEGEVYIKSCCGVADDLACDSSCPLVAFDEAAKFFQEDV